VMQSSSARVKSPPGLRPPDDRLTGREAAAPRWLIRCPRGRTHSNGCTQSRQATKRIASGADRKCPPPSPSPKPSRAIASSSSASSPRRSGWLAGCASLAIVFSAASNRSRSTFVSRAATEHAALFLLEPPACSKEPERA
jgi:hypothetical protein